MPTEERRKFAARVQNDFRWYARRFLWIRTKDKREVTLTPNVTQERILAAWEECERAGKPVRILILKARKEGVSTLVEAKFFHRTATSRNTSTVIVAHDEDSAIGLFDMVKLFNDRLPAPLRPMQRYSNRRELVYENPSEEERRDKPGLRSRLSVATANNVQAGRSKTPSFVHLSEAAFYRDLNTLHTAIRQAVPDLPGTAVVIESTPNGVGNGFHRLWQAAKAGENDYIPIFIAWFDNPEYASPVPEGFQPTEEERAVQRAYNLTLEQVVWRREKQKQFDSLELFQQEYPENDVDCFLFSGSPALPVDVVRTMQKTASKPKHRGFLKATLNEKDPKHPIEELTFEEDANGPLRVWKWPKPEREYVLGTDVAEGYADGDYSSVDVLDKETAEQVAQWHGHVEPDQLGEIVADLGDFYNRAMAGVERNGPGLTTLATLKRIYGPIYKSVQIDERTNKTTEKLGWLTNLRTKPIMVDELRSRLRERSVRINSPETLDECLTFVRLPDGSTGAQVDCKDDRVMSICVALQVLKHHPYVAPVKRRKRPTYTPDPITAY